MIFWDFAGACLLLLVAWLTLTKPWRMPVVIADVRPGGRRIDGAGWFGNYYPAQAGAPRPGILVVGGSEGGLHDQVDRDARTLNREGYSALALSFFRGPGQQAQLALIPLELFDHALDWLREQPEVDATRLAVVGMSKGAEAALLVASRREDIVAVVAAVASSVVWPGFDWSRFRGLRESSWSINGDALPMLPYGRFIWSKGVRSIYESGLERLPDYPDAAIPIERSKAEILLICGGEDQVWPSCVMADQIASRVLAHRGEAVTVLSYPEADHGVFASPLEAGDRPRRFGFGRPSPGNAAAQADSWPRVVAFLRASFADAKTDVRIPS
jgi:dienelactone hydrolase